MNTTQQQSRPCVLTINGGSSSIRFAVYEAGQTPRRRLDGKIDRLGLSGTNLIVNDPAGTPQVPRRLAAADHRTAAGVLLNWLEAQDHRLRHDHKLIEHKQYIDTYGEDLPEIRNWKWGATNAGTPASR